MSRPICKVHWTYRCECDRAPAPKPAPEPDAAPDLFAVPRQAPAQKRETSERAAAKVSETLPQRRRDLLWWFCSEAPEGATDNEALAALVPRGWSPNGVRPRRIELQRGGWLDEKGERGGSLVWVPTEQAENWYNLEKKRAA